MLIIYLLFLIIIFSSIRKQNENEIFSKNNTKSLQGLFSIFVLFHHLGQYLKIDGIFGTINELMGGIPVGVFFFLSAYGLIKSAEYDQNYYKKLLKKRIPTLYIEQIIINFIYFIILFLDKNLKFIEIVIRILNFDIFFGLQRLNGYSWYITSILLIYFIFCLLLLINKSLKIKRIIFLIILTTTLIVIQIIVKEIDIIENIYIRSLNCFIFGIWYANYDVHINHFLKNKLIFYVLSVVLILLIGLFIYINYIFTHLGTCEPYIAVGICLLIIILQQKIKINNKFFQYLGKISLEVYLFQQLILKSTEKLITNSGLFISINIILVLSLSIIFNYSFSKIKEKLF